MIFYWKLRSIRRISILDEDIRKHWSSVFLPKTQIWLFHLHWRCSVRKAVLRNFGKFTEKHLCQRLFSNKVAGLGLAQVFSCEFYEISTNTFLQNNLWATFSVSVMMMIIIVRKVENKKSSLTRSKISLKW